MCARSYLRQLRCRGATLIELSIVISLIVILSALYLDYDQRRIHEQIVAQVATEIQSMVDAAMAYQIHEGVWPLDDCIYNAYIEGERSDCNADLVRDFRDINGLRELVASGYLKDKGLSALGIGQFARGKTLFDTQVIMSPVHRIAPAQRTALSTLLSPQAPLFPAEHGRYHTTAYWEIYEPGDSRLLTITSTGTYHPGDAPGLRIRYILPRGDEGPYGCFARDISQRVPNATLVQSLFGVQYEPDPPLLVTGVPDAADVYHPVPPEDLGSCRLATRELAVEVYLRRWEPPTSLPDVEELSYETIFTPQLRLTSAGGAGIPMLLDAMNTGELRLRAAVATLEDVASTDAMIQFAKATTHPTAPLGGIVTLRGVDEGHLAIMSGYVPGGADASRSTFTQTTRDHRHLSSLAFERLDGTHIGLLSADLLSYAYDDSSLSDVAFIDRAITLSVGDAARASRHAGWRAHVSELGTPIAALSPAASLEQSDSLGLRLYNVRNYEVGAIRIYGGRMSIMPGHNFYGSFSSSASLYFVMDSEDDAGLPDSDAYRYPGDGILLNELTVVEGLHYDPPAGTLSSAGVLQSPAQRGDFMRVPLVGAGAPGGIVPSGYPSGFVLSPSTAVELQFHTNNLRLSYVPRLIGLDLELHEASMNLAGMQISTLDFTVNGRDGLFGQTAITSLDGGIEQVESLNCVAGSPRCPTP